jgi:hypothetical protein
VAEEPARQQRRRPDHRRRRRRPEPKLQRAFQLRHRGIVDADVERHLPRPRGASEPETRLCKGC